MYVLKGWGPIVYRSMRLTLHHHHLNNFNTIFSLLSFLNPSYLISSSRLQYINPLKIYFLKFYLKIVSYDSCLVIFFGITSYIFESFLWNKHYHTIINLHPNLIPAPVLTQGDVLCVHLFGMVNKVLLSGFLYLYLVCTVSLFSHVWFCMYVYYECKYGVVYCIYLGP